VSAVTDWIEPPACLGDDRNRTVSRRYRRAMRCPACACVDDKVVDSRMADDGTAIRRRRECLGCGRRFTTYERLEESSLVVVKRSGVRQPFDRVKVVAGLAAAAKNRPVTEAQLEQLAADVEEELRLEGPEVGTEAVGRAVLRRLEGLDHVAYVRFASVYKGFEDIDDFRREVVALTKSTAPKPIG
jgi:transcriptional repressor NrdR